MPRRTTQRYRCHELEDLGRQLLYAPPERRIEAFKRAETLHDELDKASNYPLEFLVFRITGRRVPSKDDATLVGEAVLPDLRLLIDSLSRSVAVLPGADGPEETTVELADRLGVSTKTIARWRRAGLRWRWVTPGQGGRPRVVFPASAVARFEQGQHDRMAKAAAFSRMPEPHKQQLVARARRLASAVDVTLNQVATHLAKRTGRGHETIRQLLEKYDAEHPDAPIFADRTGPLTGRQRAVIARAYRRGVRVARLCGRFGRTRSTIYRTVHDVQARELRAVDLTYIKLPVFDREDADEVILRADTQPGPIKRLSPEALADLPEPLAERYGQPVLGDKAIRSGLVRYNYLKYRADLAVRPLRDAEPLASDIARARALLDRVADARRDAVLAGLPIVLSVCRRHAALHRGAPAGVTLELLYPGNEELFATVEAFDPGKSTRFESVLTNRLLRDFARLDTDDGRSLAKRRSDPGRLAQAVARQLAAVGID